ARRGSTERGVVIGESRGNAVVLREASGVRILLVQTANGLDLEDGSRIATKAFILAFQKGDERDGIISRVRGGTRARLVCFVFQMQRAGHRRRSDENVPEDQGSWPGGVDGPGEHDVVVRLVQSHDAVVEVIT